MLYQIIISLYLVIKLISFFLMHFISCIGRHTEPLSFYVHSSLKIKFNLVDVFKVEFNRNLGSKTHRIKSSSSISLQNSVLWFILLDEQNSLWEASNSCWCFLLPSFIFQYNMRSAQAINEHPSPEIPILAVQHQAISPYGYILFEICS